MDNYKSCTKHSEYTFENFITGRDNLSAFNAAQTFADSSGKGIPPLILYGCSGIGKTHLVNAVVNRMLHVNPDLKHIIKPGEIFINEFIAALGKGRLESFKKRYRRLDLLVIEHIQIFQKKEETPLVLGSIIDHLRDNNKKVLITSDSDPENMDLNGLLMHSIKKAQIVKLLKPKPDTRRDFIRQQIELNKMNLTEEMIEYIAGNIRSSIRAIDSYLSILYFLQNNVKQEPLAFKDIKKEIRNFRG